MITALGKRIYIFFSALYGIILLLQLLDRLIEINHLEKSYCFYFAFCFVID